jgi:hypothetical protein
MTDALAILNRCKIRRSSCEVRSQTAFLLLGFGINLIELASQAARNDNETNAAKTSAFCRNLPPLQYLL